MTWFGLIWKNLLRRKVRTALTAAGVAIGVALIVALLSISAGVRDTARELIHVGRSDFALFQAGASDLTRSLLPASLAQKIRNESGVQRVAKVKFLSTDVEGQDSFLVFGLDRKEFPYRRLVINEGKRAQNDQVMIGDLAAKQLHKKVGDTLNVSGHKPLLITGIYHSGNRFVDLGAVADLPFVQGLAQRPGEITTIAIEVKVGADPNEVATQIKKRFQGVAAITEPGQAIKVDTSSRLIINAGWVFSIIALIVGGIAVMNTMAMSVFERMHEIGILRAIGWKGTRIAAMIVTETLGICLLAIVLGFSLGVLAAELIVDQGALSSLVTPTFTPAVFAWGLAFGLLVGLLGALYPAWRAVRLKPIEALQKG